MKPSEEAIRQITPSVNPANYPTHHIADEDILPLHAHSTRNGDIFVPIGPTPSNIINRSVFGL